MKSEKKHLDPSEERILFLAAILDTLSNGSVAQLLGKYPNMATDISQFVQEHQDQLQPVFSKYFSDYSPEQIQNLVDGTKFVCKMAPIVCKPGATTQIKQTSNELAENTAVEDLAPALLGLALLEED